MQQAHRHHLVPRFYLEYFANEKQQVRQIWVPGERSHLSNIKNVSVINDFYTVTLDVDGQAQLTDFWERAFSNIEGVASTAFANVVKRSIWPPSTKDREALAAWIALQKLRTGAMRDQQAEILGIHYSLIVGVNGIAKLRQVMEQHLGRTVGDLELEAEWSDLTQPGGPSVVGNAQEHIETILRLMEPTMDLLVGSGMSLWRFDRKKLVTSDNPVVLLGDPAPFGQGVGMANADFVAVPLSRFVALAISKPGERDTAHGGTTVVARTFNSAVSSQARRWVVSHPDDDPDVLQLQLNDPRDRELGPVDLSRFMSKDRPLETVEDVAEDTRAPSEQRIPLTYPGWPLAGRRFANPYSPPNH